MEFLFDSAAIGEIKKYGDYFPYTGVTTNPSIIKSAGKIDFFPHFREIRRIIGSGRTLHVQVVASNYEDILKEADALLSHIDEYIYVKIPTTEDGLKAMQILKKQKINITATAIYSKIQGFMAISAGADFIAPYYNRMENLDIHSADTIAAFAQMIEAGDYPAKIVAASFKNIAQANNAFLAGAHAVTLPPLMLHDAFCMATVRKAVEDFANDWNAVFENKGILDMVKLDKQ